MPPKPLKQHLVNSTSSYPIYLQLIDTGLDDALEWIIALRSLYVIGSLSNINLRLLFMPRPQTTIMSSENLSSVLRRENVLWTLLTVSSDKVAEELLKAQPFHFSELPESLRRGQPPSNLAAPSSYPDEATRLAARLIPPRLHYGYVAPAVRLLTEERIFDPCHDDDIYLREKTKEIFGHSGPGYVDILREDIVGIWSLYSNENYEKAKDEAVLELERRVKAKIKELNDQGYELQCGWFVDPEPTFNNWTIGHAW